ncbi:MAG: hypothetical protein BAJATHORv1_30079 [Candidatus Thorarchaeota archaeon]|nr:MAG: hypothetical protein BAJATHORv1_30079 [Candidatus Thorarchaeota archaeon]
MAIGQTLSAQLQLEPQEAGSNHTVFSPPGVAVETAKYPIMWAGVLASTQASEWLSIYDHPIAWEGIQREAILAMREHLYRFVVPINAREMMPNDNVEVLQTVALSVSPVTLNVEVGPLPPRTLQTIGGLLPSSPRIQAKSMKIVSDPEISIVAEKISQRDVPASESIWTLLDFEYTLDQVAKMTSLGLLGKLKRRRIIPLRAAYKVVIDNFIDRAIAELLDKPESNDSKLYISDFLGDSFVVVVNPGSPKVDYIHLNDTDMIRKRTLSIDGEPSAFSEPKTMVYADHARFASYSYMLEEKKNSHITIFHHSRHKKNEVLGPWVTRAGVADAFKKSSVHLGDPEVTKTILDSLLAPNLEYWTKDTRILNRMNLEETPYGLVLK